MLAIVRPFVLLAPVFVSAVFSFAARAAVPSAPPSLSAMEVLSMPEANQVAIAKKQSQNFYRELIQISFSSDRSVQMRWKALILAAQMQPERSQNDIERALHEKDWFMKNAALVALKTINPKRAERAAVKLLSDKALVVRSAAVNAMTDEPEANLRQTLWEEFRADYNFRKGQSLWVREDILRKLSKHPEKYEMPYFIAALRDRDQALHVPAIEALESMSGKHFGTSHSTVYEKKTLWLDYAAKNGSVMN